MTKLNPNGRVIYRGISRLDDKTPIVVIVTGLKGSSANRKTGAMLQTWILLDNGTEPHAAVKSGTDGAICGDCPFAGGKGCYVTVFQAPLSVYRAYQRGVYQDATLAELTEIGADRKVRISSYGDPAAVPVTVWESLTRNAATWTGYTHQWRNPDNADLARYCMASTESTWDQMAAGAFGFRSFRVSANADPIPGDEIVCPASDEGGRKTTCADCGLCKGNTTTARNIVIVAHGAGTKKAKTALLAIA